jgi:hypothetical protein
MHATCMYNNIVKTTMGVNINNNMLYVLLKLSFITHYYYSCMHYVPTLQCMTIHTPSIPVHRIAKIMTRIDGMPAMYQYTI